jgi:uncharacterized membrane protein YdjX (TVP38/TMEM64 family)
MLERRTAGLWFRLFALLAIVATISLFAWRYGDRLSLDQLAEHESALLEFGQKNRVLVLSGLFALYVGVTASSLPAATALTFLSAWLLRQLFGPIAGFFGAVALVSFASTAGATLAFLLSRSLFRDLLWERYGQRAAQLDAALRRDGAFALFTLRLTPVVPFWLVNLAMGLTPIRTRTFWWVSQLGMLPGTLVLVFAGQQVPTLAELHQQSLWDLLWPGPILAFLLLAAFPWAARWIVRRSPTRLPEPHNSIQPHE